MSDIRQLRLEYLSDICAALTQYVEEGGEMHLESDTREGDVLQILFTLGQGEKFQATLRQTMMRRLSR